MIGYLTSDTSQKYEKIKLDFEKIKAFVSNELILDHVILISNNRYSDSMNNFINSKEKYFGKNIKLFLVRENDIIDIIGPITLIDNNMFFTIISWITEFIGTDQYFDFYENINKYFTNFNYPKEKLVCYK